MSQSGVVVVGVDGSPGSTAALEFAVEEAVRRQARLRVVAVVQLADYWGGWRGTAAAYTGRWPAPPEDLVADARAQTQRMVDEVTAAHPDLTLLVSVDVETAAGGPAAVLLDAAKGADLLVLGHRGAGAFSSAVLGSVGLQCVLHATGPVTIVRPTQPPGPPRAMSDG
jgi:nucleotide-binding universal stress UspA family protein